MTTSTQGVQLEMRSKGAMESHLAALAITSVSLSKELHADIGEYMLAQVLDSFDHQVLFSGAAMPQSQSAIDRSGKTLIDHHHLYDSYVYQLTPDGVEIGSNSAYARIHHFGGKAGRGHHVTLPARPVLGMTDESERIIGAMILADLQHMQPRGAV